LIVVKKYLKVFRAADAMVVIAFRAYEEVFPQFGDGAYIVAIRALGPEALGSFLFFGCACQNAFFDAPEPTALAFFTLSFIPCQVCFKVFLFHGFHNLSHCFLIPDKNRRFFGVLSGRHRTVR
jgi:hypothetical protein